MYNIGSKNCCILEIQHFHPLSGDLGKLLLIITLFSASPECTAFGVSLNLLFYSVLTLSS